MASDSKSMQAAQYQLPNDVIWKILLPISVKNLSKFRLVCKSWDSIISDPHFRKLHLDRSQQNPRLLAISGDGVFGSFDTKGTLIEEFRPLIESLDATMGLRLLQLYSCSELVYFRSGTRNRIYVCNPTTKELLALPENSFPLISGVVYHKEAVGLGYVSNPKIYKVISILYTSCEVFTIGIDREWRALAEFPYRTVGEGGTFANGSLHFSCLEGILCFDLDLEEWSVLQIPQPLADGPMTQLTQLQGFLCIVQHIDEQSGYSNHIWFLKNNVWVKVYVFNLSWDPILLMENGRILIKRYNRDTIGKTVVCFDKTENRCEEMESLTDIHDVTVYVEGFHKLATS